MPNYQSPKFKSKPPLTKDFQLAVAKLDTKNPNPFKLIADKDFHCQFINDIEDIILNSLRFEGTINFIRPREWHLFGIFQASVTQQCVITLEPISNSIEVKVQRQFIKHPHQFAASANGEIPKDDTIEKLNDFINLAEIARETLLLEIPNYPRKPNLAQGDFISEGSDDDNRNANWQKPFSVLAELKKNYK